MSRSIFEQPDSPTDLPSYEYSVTEKARSQGPPRPPREIVDEHGWLIYDAGAFEQAANEASSASSSASVSVSSRQSSSLRSRPSIMKRPQRSQLNRLVVVNGRESPEDEPPPFTPTIPSYDGPAYAHQHPQLNSRPASPLHSPPAHTTRFGTPPPRTSTRPALPSAPSAHSQSNSPAAYASPRAVRSIPVQDRSTPNHTRTHTSAAAPGSSPFSLSHTSFNPNMAYASSSAGSGSASTDVSAFYGSHVASAMTPTKAANSASSQLYQSSTNSSQLGHRSQASLSTPPSPLLNREFSTDRSSVYSRVSDSSVGSTISHSSAPAASVRVRASNANIHTSPPPGAAYGLGPSARMSMGGVSTYSNGSAPSSRQWASTEDQLVRDIYGSR